MTDVPTPKKVARGRAIRWTDEQLDAMATITPEDIEAAGLWWRRNAPDKYKSLLDAEVDEDAPTA